MQHNNPYYRDNYPHTSKNNTGVNRVVRGHLFPETSTYVPAATTGKRSAIEAGLSSETELSSEVNSSSEDGDDEPFSAMITGVRFISIEDIESGNLDMDDANAIDDNTPVSMDEWAAPWLIPYPRSCPYDTRSARSFDDEDEMEDDSNDESLDMDEADEIDDNMPVDPELLAEPYAEDMLGSGVGLPDSTFPA